ncbi:MAG: squalene/phytoene synthase family protein, partial [Candidatus Baltobacteraceae bacterium]
VDELFAGSEPAHPVLLALRETVERIGLRADPFLALIDANVQDQQVRAYATWPALRAYCTLSAAPVGRMVLAVFGIEDARAAGLSDDVCIGLQLANFAQDVARDAALGRRYLVEADVAEGGVVGAIRTLCERARSLLAAGVALEHGVGPALRMQLALYRLGGLTICDAVAAGGYRTDLVRPTLSKATQLGLVVRVLATTAFARGGSRHAQPA